MILSAFVTIIYTIIVLSVGLILGALSLHLRGIIDLSGAYNAILNTPNLWLVLASISLLLMIIGVSVSKMVISKFRREKTIAFANPEGQVTVALTAIEDYIRRAAVQIPEVKDIRSNVVAKKGTINITTRVSLWADINIPEVTEKVQSIIKSRVQNMLGIEEQINVRVHIAKLVQREEKHKKQAEDTMFRGREVI